MTRCAPLLTSLAALLAGCSGPPPQPLPIQQVYVPRHLRIRMEALRTAAHIHSTKTLLVDALANWESEQKEMHGTLDDDCADAPDSGERIEHFCARRPCGKLDEDACVSKFRPPCEPGLVFVPKSSRSARYGLCRALGDAGADDSTPPHDR